MAKIKKNWTESELMQSFKLIRAEKPLPELKDWLAVTNPQLLDYEQSVFDEWQELIIRKGDFWNEESLKMNFIAPFLQTFIKLNDRQKRYESFYDIEISATVEGIYLQTECDFMLAKGIGELAQTPYFHFQEHKRNRRNPPNQSPNS
jgi:hypothetical protein